MQILSDMKEKMLYKTCVCCGMTRSEDNFRRLSRSEGRGAERINWTSSVCKLCEKKGLPSKEERLAKLKERAAKIKANTEKRLKREHLIALELEEML